MTTPILTKRGRLTASRAAALFDGTSSTLVRDPLILIDGATIIAVDSGVPAPDHADITDLHCHYLRGAAEPTAKGVQAAVRELVGLTIGVLPVPGLSPFPEVRKRMPAILANMRRMHEAGELIVASSDAGVAPLKPHDAIRYDSPTIWTVPENHLIRVLADASEQQWPLTASRRGRDWLIAITRPDGMNWAAEGPDLFKALRALRRILDPLGIRLGVNGARRDAWASGMQCDMGEGRVVYLLVEGQASRPEQVSTLGSTSVSHVGTVGDQDQQHERWLHSRRTAN